MRKLIMYALFFALLWWLYNALQDERFDHHARRLEQKAKLNLRDDWSEFGAAIDTLLIGDDL